MFDHGFNDYVGDESSYDPSDPMSTFTYRGACNFIFNEILSKQPKSIILFVGLTCYGIRAAQAEQQIVVAEDWNFPFIRLWDYLAWSEKEVTTTGGWNDDGTWNDNKYPNGHVMKLREIAMPDGIHPHTDRTNGALNQISMILSSWISSQGYYSPVSDDDYMNYWK